MKEFNREEFEKLYHENMSIEKVSQLTDGITPMKTESREYSLLNYETSAGILADITITLKQIPVEEYYGNIGDIEKYKTVFYIINESYWFTHKCDAIL